MWTNMRKKNCKTEKQFLFSSSNTKLDFYQLQFNTALTTYSYRYTVIILDKRFCCCTEGTTYTTYYTFNNLFLFTFTQ